MANPILVDAMKYYSERADMNNPKGWDHVLRQYQHALSVPDSPWADVEEATKAEALTVLRALVDLEATTEVPTSAEPQVVRGSSQNLWKLKAEAYRAALVKVKQATSHERGVIGINSAVHRLCDHLDAVVREVGM